MPSGEKTHRVSLGDFTRVAGDDESTIQISSDISSTPVIAGEKVWLTIISKIGMRLKSDTLKAKYNDGIEKELTLLSNTNTFTMPAYEVEVTAEFEISDASLISVLSQTHGGELSGLGTDETNPFSWWITVSNDKIELKNSDIVVSEGASCIMYSDNLFNNAITEQALSVGYQSVRIKVVSQSGKNSTYYSVGVKREAQ